MEPKEFILKKYREHQEKFKIYNIELSENFDVSCIINTIERPSKAYVCCFDRSLKEFKSYSFTTIETDHNAILNNYITTEMESHLVKIGNRENAIFDFAILNEIETTSKVII